MKYSEFDDRVPYLAGSFTGWRYMKMIDLEELNRSKDPYPRNLLKMCQDARQIRKSVKSEDKLNDWERRHYDIAILE